MSADPFADFDPDEDCRTADELARRLANAGGRVWRSAGDDQDQRA